MDEYIHKSGHLDVGDDHKIYFEDWGNLAAQDIIFYLHGGPGAGTKPKYRYTFNPKQHRVIFHDQRGSGKSTPKGELNHNTTQDLISDITKLADHLKIDKFSIVGGSWGSTLALLYSIENPERVEQLMIWGIYQANKQDEDFLFGGGVSSHFPEVWDDFIQKVPPEHRSQPAKYYADVMSGKDKKLSLEYAKAFAAYEGALLSLDYDPANIYASKDDEQGILQFASIEAYYLARNCFIEYDYIEKNLGKIKDKNITMIHGRYDFVCLPKSAYELHKLLPKSRLHFVTGNHRSSEQGVRDAIRTHASYLFK